MGEKRTGVRLSVRFQGRDPRRIRTRIWARKTYAYDPHLDPQLQWAGKTEHTSFEVPTVSLHVHERIDPRSIIEAVIGD